VLAFEDLEEASRDCRRDRHTGSPQSELARTATSAKAHALALPDPGGDGVDQHVQNRFEARGAVTGGTRQSGYGRENGFAAIEEYHAAQDDLGRARLKAACGARTARP
jgi:hypothetical protein